jgi:hypothetical protein
MNDEMEVLRDHPIFRALLDRLQEPNELAAPRAVGLPPQQGETRASEIVDEEYEPKLGAVVAEVTAKILCE